MRFQNSPKSRNIRTLVRASRFIAVLSLPFTWREYYVFIDFYIVIISFFFKCIISNFYFLLLCICYIFIMHLSTIILLFWVLNYQTANHQEINWRGLNFRGLNCRPPLVEVKAKMWREKPLYTRSQILEAHPLHMVAVQCSGHCGCRVLSLG